MKDFKGNEDSRSCRSWLTGLGWHRPGLQWRTHNGQKQVENSCVRRGLFDYWKLVKSLVLKRRPPLSPFPCIQTARQSTGHSPFTDSESLAQKKKYQWFWQKWWFRLAKTICFNENQWKTIETNAKSYFWCKLLVLHLFSLYFHWCSEDLHWVHPHTDSQPASQTVHRSVSSYRLREFGSELKKILLVLAKVVVPSG